MSDKGPDRPKGTQFFPGMEGSLDKGVFGERFKGSFWFLAGRLMWPDDVAGEIGGGLQDSQRAFEMAFCDYCRRILSAFESVDKSIPAGAVRHVSAGDVEVALRGLMAVPSAERAVIFSDDSCIEALKSGGFEEWFLNLTRSVLRFPPYNRGRGRRVDMTVGSLVESVEEVVRRLAPAAKAGMASAQVSRATGTVFADLSRLGIYGFGGFREDSLSGGAGGVGEDLGIVDFRDVDDGYSDTVQIDVERVVQTALEGMGKKGELVGEGVTDGDVVGIRGAIAWAREAISRAVRRLLKR